MAEVAGTGRRAALKTRCPRGRAGSSPAFRIEGLWCKGSMAGLYLGGYGFESRQVPLGGS